MPSSDTITSGPTFAEMLVQNGLLDDASNGTRALIARTYVAVEEYARVHLKVISCFDCTEPKGCCKQKVAAGLFEVVPIVARLKHEGRDTPELRKQLKEAAHYMETVPAGKHKRPCVFLDPNDRCTVYEDRPSVCGMAFVTSPATQCNVPDGQISKVGSEANEKVRLDFDYEFRMRAGLRAMDRRYAGALPRMVLIALEAWDRRDYVSFLADRCLPASHRFEQIMRG